MKRLRHETNLKRNEIKTKRKRNYNEITANLKRVETKRNAFPLASCLRLPLHINRNQIKTKRNELTTNLKRDETKRKTCTLALTGDDARALSVSVQRPGDGKSLSASEV